MGPKKMAARFGGTCGNCTKTFPAGTLIFFNPDALQGYKSLHVDCENPENPAPRRDPSDLRYLSFKGGRRCGGKSLSSSRYGRRWRGEN